jgi:predicted acylesterase/phospholipase RssA
MSVKPKIGLALAGGGFLGAAYELGALAALQESIHGLDLTELDTYVGVSAGSFLAAGLANGLSPVAMVRLFIEDDSPELVFDPATMLSPDTRELRRALARSPKVLGKALVDGLRSEGLRPKQLFWRAIERSGDLLPEGLIDASPARARLRHLLKARGRADDFRKLSCRLRIVATDVDSGEPIEFGGPRFDDVPISTAVAASSAVPGLFAPVRIGERRYLDGAINKTLHASVALREGARLVFCINPLVPYSGSGSEPFRRMNLPGLLSQSIRTAIRSRMSVGLEKYRATHPEAHVVLFEPQRDDAQTFFTGMFSLTNRRRLCEHAYQQTRRDLLRRSDELSKPLASAGLSLDIELLQRPDLTLVMQAPGRVPPNKPLALALRRLDSSLAELQRALRLAGQKV